MRHKLPPSKEKRRPVKYPVPVCILPIEPQGAAIIEHAHGNVRRAVLHRRVTQAPGARVAAKKISTGREPVDVRFNRFGGN